MNFHTTLLRERFEIYEKNKNSGDGQKTPVIALSNRIVVPLLDTKGMVREEFVVRAQNMHCTIRMAAKILQEYRYSGSIMSRNEKFDWESAWDSILSEYEKRYNDQRWCAVYNQGKPVFETGDHHPFLDMIEQCDLQNRQNYDNAIHLAENIFAQKGKPVTITHDANIALVINTKKKAVRTGIILRSAEQTTTFNFRTEPNTQESADTPQCMRIAAAFLEGLQLAFHLGMINEKIDLELLDKNGDDGKRAKSIQQRLNKLSNEILNFENRFEVHYRPDKPQFDNVVRDAQNFIHERYAESQGDNNEQQDN